MQFYNKGCSRIFLTKCVNEILLAHQFHIFVNSLCGQCILPENQSLIFSQALNFCTTEINQELLHNQKLFRNLKSLCLFLQLLLLPLTFAFPMLWST